MFIGGRTAIVGALALGAALAVRAELRGHPLGGIEIGRREDMYPGEVRLVELRRTGYDSAALRLSAIRATDVVMVDGVDSETVQRRNGTFTFELKTDTTRVIILLEGRPKPAHLVLVKDEGSSFVEASRPSVEAGLVSLVESDIPLGRETDEQVVDWIPSPEAGGVPSAFSGVVAQGAGANSSTDRLMPIALTYANWLVGRAGVPPDSATALSPVMRLRWLTDERSRGWCYDFSVGFLALASRAGLSARMVALHAPRSSDIWMGNHAANEVFDVEWRRWRLVDFTLGIFEVRDATGAPLDAARFLDSMRGDAPPEQFEFLWHDAINGLVRGRWADLPLRLQSQLRFEYGPRQSVSIVRHPAETGDIADDPWSQRFSAAKARYVLVDAPDGSAIIGVSLLRRAANAVLLLGILLLGISTASVLHYLWVRKS